MRRAELVHYLTLAREASELIMRGLNSAADLVQSFKQVAVDRTTAQRAPTTCSKSAMRSSPP